MRPYNYNPGGTGFRIGPGYITPVIKALIIGNGVIFLIQSFAGWNLTGYLGLNPDLFFKEFPNFFFQPLTYMFLHGGIFHLAWNMFALWMFGTEIESAWGKRTFLFYYVLCGFGGALLSLIFTPYSQATIIGASGAIYGILGAYWLMFPNRYFIFPLPMKVKYAIPIFAVLTFLLGGARVAHLAHLGGALIGLAYLKLDWRIYRPWQWWRRVKYRRQVAKQEKKRMEAEEVMKRVDAILDKINEVGIDNISREEQQFLNDASQILSKKDKN